MKINIIAGWLNPEECIGTMNITKTRGREVISVEIDQDWLKKHNSFILDPDLSAFKGLQYPPFPKKLFGFLSDSSPDRWGRKLIERKEKYNADREQRQIRTLNASDYLLGVSDILRYGGIRFQNAETGNYYSTGSTKIPPMADIRMLESASRDFELSDNDAQVLKLILEPGSSLGGARPKANVIDTDGSLWIAKFPSTKDDYDIGAWEMTEHDLAEICGIQVPEARVMGLSSHGSTFLTRRFDRDENGKRFHLMSAMTALGMTDGNTEGAGYLDIAGQIEEMSVSPLHDLQELWRRMIFNILTSNCDDHLRNHGFILRESGWRLSPAYDLNPVVGKDSLSLNITDRDNRKNIQNAIEISDFFRVTESEARELADYMQKTIAGSWKSIASKYHISEHDMRFMEPAFSECNHSI